MRNRKTVIVAALGAALAAGCDSVPKNAITSCQQDVHVLPAQTDLLFVVDDSGSMAEEQENLRQNLAAFIDRLATSPVPNDFRIGVTTTDVHATNSTGEFFPYTLAPYDQFTFKVPYPEGRLVAIDPGALTTPALRGKPVYDEHLGYVGDRILTAADVTKFETNVLVGVLGSSKEEPFRATELALSARITDGTNAGFLRSGARLGIVILTDEDDCSERVPLGSTLAAGSNATCHDPTIKATRLESIADFRAFLDGPIDGELRHPVVAVIAGFDPTTLEATPRCTTSYDSPTRLAGLLDALGPERSFRGSICDASFGQSLERIADLLVPQTVPIDGAPPDARMLVAAVHRRDGSTVTCPVAPEGDAEAAQAGAVYSPPQAGQPPTLTFQGTCHLGSGDRVELKIVCAG